MNTCYNGGLSCRSCENEENHHFIYAFWDFSSTQIQNECIVYHEGFKDIRDKNSGMMQAILAKVDE